MKRGLRLWQKLFLLTLFLTVAAITSISIFHSQSNLHWMWEREHAAAVQNHSSLAMWIQNAVFYEQIRENSAALSSEKLSALLADAMENAGDGASLYQKDTLAAGTLSTALAEEAALLAEMGAENTYYSKLSEAGGRTILLTASRESILDAPYTLITAFDITGDFARQQQQASQTLLFSTGFALAAAVLLLFAIRRAFSPLDKMNQGVNRIAQGNYGERLAVCSPDELGELAENMNRMTLAIRETVTLLEQEAENRKLFIDNLTHEMKTPLTTIMGYGDMLRIQKEVPEERRLQYGTIIVEEAKRLRTLSEKLMQLITVGTSDRSGWTRLSARSILRQAADTLQPLLQSREIALQVTEADFEVTVDLALFSSLLYNLVDNASKASRRGQAVELSASLENGLRVFSVKDSGVGIPQEALLKIKEPFYMVDKSRSRQWGGAGLGLALCDRIAGLHRARLEIASAPGEGTCVKVVFEKEDDI